VGKFNKISGLSDLLISHAASCRS